MCVWGEEGGQRKGRAGRVLRGNGKRTALALEYRTRLVPVQVRCSSTQTEM